MVYITGDCHGDFRRLGMRYFAEQEEMTRDDVLIILGDFGGIWDYEKSGNEENYWLRWLGQKSFTILFVDGNHENFDRLREFPVVDLYGGKAHKIRDNIYHLMRGYVFEIEGKKFFAFGGASSHDIKDGILDPDSYLNQEDFKKIYKSWRKQRKEFRVNHVSWWEDELPTDSELEFAEQTLKTNNNEVDYVITHCCPQEIASVISFGAYKPDKLTMWFNKMLSETTFSHWYFGHYHDDRDIYGKFHMRYLNIERIL